MSRRQNQLFNLSFLDLMTGALGAVIFLFIITPKGGESAAQVRQAMVYFDTTEMKIHGALPDSLLYKQAGNTLLMVLLDYQDLPKVDKKPEKPIVFNWPEKQPTPTPVPEKPTPKPEKKPEKPTPKPEPEIEKPPAPKPPEYKGDAPSVPCVVSVELNWGSLNDNVDLFVCKGNDCVYGGRKKDNNIGQWDSGKSRNRIFGSDLRTTQEAVRQFDKIIPGEYKVFAKFKDSENNRNTVTIRGLIYTKDAQGNERGETFIHRLPLGDEQVLIGTLQLQANGTYNFIRRP